MGPLREASLAMQLEPAMAGTPGSTLPPDPQVEAGPGRAARLEPQIVTLEPATARLSCEHPAMPV